MQHLGMLNEPNGSSTRPLGLSKLNSWAAGATKWRARAWAWVKQGAQSYESVRGLIKNLEIYQKKNFFKSQARGLKVQADLTQSIAIPNSIPPKTRKKKESK